ncbi:tyrosine-protein kinase JAK2 [Ixodes scapularis]
MLTADHTVCILFYTPREPLLVPGKDGAHTAEHLCMQAAELCGIGPVTAQLFGLFSAETGIWFAPSANVKAKDKSLNLYFRLRYKPPTLDRIKAEEATLNYVYHQMRQDFVCGRVPELHHNRVQHRTLGLVVTDVVRHLIEAGQSPQQGSFSFSDFMPAVLVGPLKMRVLKPRLTNALNECWHNSRQNVNRVKEIYVNEFRSIVPEYGCEQFVAQVDSDGRVWEVVLQVNPHHPQMPGLRMHSKASKESITWTHICSISDLCFVNMNLSNCTVEISRRNGIPQNIRFSSVSRMQSFLSLLDGYYRLMEKWTVNLCINLPTPSLTALRAMRCHGPIGARFAYQKLQEKSDHESGWYLLRQSSSAYREFRLDFLGQDETPETLRIVQSAEDGTFRLDQGEGQAFPSLAKLVNDGVKPMLSLELGYCVPPSEYDKTQLLLCRAPGTVAENVAAAREPRECIHSRSLAFSENRKDELHGRFTVVRRAFLCKAKNLHREVAVKSLKPHLEDSHLKEFMAQCDRMLFWQCEAMVSSVGMVHSGSFGLVTEFLPLGSLDLYLRQHRLQLQAVDLVEAAKGLARALWYLEEQGCVHGKVRCHNILVSQHEANAFYVKLSDPGLLIYGEGDVHWIPPEFYHSFSLARSSVKADIWAFGTTLWEIFTFGETPMAGLTNSEALKKYREGERLRIPADLHEGIRTLLAECWSVDPDNRPQPQTIMRDINQIFYEVYNSRRSHSYASVYPQAPLGVARNARPPSGPASPFPSPTAAAADSNRRSENVGAASAGASPSPGSGDALSLRRGFKWAKNPFRLHAAEVSYDNLSSCSTSTTRSEATLQTDIGTCIDVESLISLEERNCCQVYMRRAKLTAELTDEERQEYKTQLLLCRAPGTVAENVAAAREPRECIHSRSLAFSENRKDELHGRFTVVRRAFLCKAKNLHREVAVKSLKPHLEDSHLKEFMAQCDRMLFWQCEAMVSSVGMVHSGSFGLVTEFLPLGSLDLYLRQHRLQLQAVDLVEAAKGLARALWYLEEQGCVHGKVRCHNILVSQHEANAFYVKLSDPGLLIYGEGDVHWIPPEFYHSFSLARSSVKADIWAFGTTLWEIFTFGETPMAGLTNSEALKKYREGERLRIPADLHEGIRTLLAECWSVDPDNRPQPQTIMRDINQIFYEVYNSRRSHSYASVYPQAPLGVARNARPPSGPASPFPSPTAAAADSNRRSENVGAASAGASPSPGSGDALSLRRGFKWAKNPFRLHAAEVSYDNLSSCSTSTTRSEATLQTDIGTCIDVESLISLEESPENAICFGNTSPMTEVSASPWVIDSQQLVKGKPLGQGFFGEVYAASLKKWAGLQEEVVAVKCMRKSSLLELFQSESGLRDLQREIEIMKNLRHPNIVEIKGLVEEPEMMLVMEFLEMGSLLTYLQTYQTKVSHPQLVKYSEDIANGMEYLEEKHIVHRDLAARNILVASKDLVKISDFGLAQFTVGHYYYIHTQNRKLPMKWYAPESILYGKFSTKSDVWSYGVTLWEMFSYGEDPVIQDVTQENLGAELLDGKRLPCPPGCPTDIYRLMQLCWTTDSHQRPGFAQVKNFVRDL